MAWLRFLCCVLAGLAAHAAAAASPPDALASARAHARAGMPRQALAILKTFEPASVADLAELKRSIGSIYLDLGQPAKAASHFADALNDLPENAAALLGAAEAAIRSGDVAAGRGHLRSAAALGQARRFEIAYLEALAEQLTGQPGAAKIRLLRLAASEPLRDEPYFHLARLLAAAGRGDEAVALLDKQLGRFRDSALLRDLLSDLLPAQDGERAQSLRGEALRLYEAAQQGEAAASLRLKLSRLAPAAGAAKAPAVRETLPPLPARRGVTNKEVRGLPESARPGTAAHPFPFPPGREISGGSGVVIDAGRRVITNRHVVDQGRDFFVRTGLGEISRAHVAYISTSDDLAVLELDSPLPKERALPAESFQKAKPGSNVVVMGYPLWHVLGSATPSLSNGVVAKNTGVNEDPTTFQLTAKINKGNSGGPVFDMQGNLVGITMGKLDSEEIRRGDGYAPEDINFAIHIDRLQAQVDLPPAAARADKRPLLRPEEIYQMMIGKVVIVAVALD